MDLFTDATQHQQFFDLSYKLTTTTTTKHSIDHYVKPNSENGPLHIIRHDELAKNMGPQICQFERYASKATHWHTHVSKNWKVWGSTSVFVSLKQIFMKVLIMKFDMINRERKPIFCWNKKKTTKNVGMRHRWKGPFVFYLHWFLNSFPDSISLPAVFVEKRDLVVSDKMNTQIFWVVKFKSVGWVL